MSLGLEDLYIQLNCHFVPSEFGLFPFIMIPKWTSLTKYMCNFLSLIYSQLLRIIGAQRKNELVFSECFIFCNRYCSIQTSPCHFIYTKVFCFIKYSFKQVINLVVKSMYIFLNYLKLVGLLFFKKKVILRNKFHVY